MTDFNEKKFVAENIKEIKKEITIPLELSTEQDGDKPLRSKNKSLLSYEDDNDEGFSFTPTLRVLKNDFFEIYNWFVTQIQRIYRRIFTDKNRERLHTFWAVAWPIFKQTGHIIAFVTVSLFTYAYKQSFKILAAAKEKLKTKPVIPVNDSVGSGISDKNNPYSVENIYDELKSYNGQRDPVNAASPAFNREAYLHPVESPLVMSVQESVEYMSTGEIKEPYVDISDPCSFKLPNNNAPKVYLNGDNGCDHIDYISRCNSNSSSIGMKWLSIGIIVSVLLFIIIVANGFSNRKNRNHNYYSSSTSSSPSSSYNSNYSSSSNSYVSGNNYYSNDSSYSSEPSINFGIGLNGGGYFGINDGNVGFGVAEDGYGNRGAVLTDGQGNSFIGYSDNNGNEAVEISCPDGNKLLIYKDEYGNGGIIPVMNY